MMKLLNLLAHFSGDRSQSKAASARQAPSAARRAAVVARPAPAPKSFQAVSIVRQSNDCAGAIALGDTRFLCSRAPALPLEGCSNPSYCTCRFRKHSDRRRDDDRRVVFAGMSHLLYGGAERRSRRGRRATD